MLSLQVHLVRINVKNELIKAVQILVRVAQTTIIEHRLVNRFEKS